MSDSNEEPNCGYEHTSNMVDGADSISNVMGDSFQNE